MHFPFRFPGLIWLSVRILVPASFPNGSVRQKYPLQTRFSLFPIIFNMKGHRKRVSGALFLLWDPNHREKRVSQATFPTIDPLVISNSGSESHKHLIIIPIFIRSVNLSVSTPGPVSVVQISHLCFSCLWVPCHIFKCSLRFLITDIFWCFPAHFPVTFSNAFSASFFPCPTK